MEYTKDEIVKMILDFAETKQVVSVASVNEKGPWISNFYFVLDLKLRLFFITNKNNLYAKNTFNISQVAYNVFWHEENNLLNRKSIQAVGKVYPLTEIIDQEKVVSLFETKYEEMGNILLYKIRKKGLGEFLVWVIEPEFIKYLDDDRLGSDGAVSINFDY